jgi:hypothetical protein
MLEVVSLDPPTPGTPGPFTVTCRAAGMAGATWTRTVSGGDGRGLVIEDVLAADEPGEYQVTFRLRLLGALAGADGDWTVTQKGAALPVRIEIAPGDAVGVLEWEPDAHTWDGGAYPWYAFNVDDGKPKTLEWTRKITLQPGESTAFKATLGPSRSVAFAPQRGRSQALPVGLVAPTSPRFVKPRNPLSALTFRQIGFVLRNRPKPSPPPESVAATCPHPRSSVVPYRWPGHCMRSRRQPCPMRTLLSDENPLAGRICSDSSDTGDLADTDVQGPA